MKSTNDETAQLHAGLALETVIRSQQAIRNRQTRRSLGANVITSLCIGVGVATAYSSWTVATKVISFVTIAMVFIAVVWLARRAVGVRSFSVPTLNWKSSAIYGLGAGVLIASNHFLFHRFGENAIWLIGAVFAVISFALSYWTVRDIDRANEEFAALPVAMQQNLSEKVNRELTRALLRYGVGFGLLVAVGFWLLLYLTDGQGDFYPWSFSTILLCLGTGWLVGSIPFLVVVNQTVKNVRAQQSEAHAITDSHDS